MKTFSVLKAGVALVALTLLAACEEDGRLASRNARHYTPVPAEMVALMSEKGTSKHAPILLRAYKQESELEIWKQNAAGEYIHLKTYPMCRWSGQLGPKKKEGDRQVPEGFYSITPASLNPNSSFYLSFNVGYPNSYDRAHGRTGAHIMVHGACSSMGCFSMTDQQIAEIYAITREAFAGGQAAIQLQSLPFRYSAQNLAKYRADPNMPFWKMLKEGADSFEVTKREPQVAVCQRKYVFNRGTSSDASGPCAPEDSSSPVVQAVAAKAASDDKKVAELVAGGVGAVRRVYKDGDQHHSFKSTQHAIASEDGRSLTPVRGGVSRVAEVSRPDALEHGAVEIPVDANGKEKKAPAAVASTAVPAAGKGATGTATAVAGAAAAATPKADAFAPTATSSTPASIFRGWMGGKTEEPAAVTAVEPEKPQPVRIPLPPKAPQRQAGSPAAPTAAAAPVAADKLVDATAAQPRRKGMLDTFVAMVPGWR
mgnify:CR=1 FL=1